MAVVSWLGIQVSRLRLPFLFVGHKEGANVAPHSRHRKRPRQARQAAPRSGAFP